MNVTRQTEDTAMTWAEVQKKTWQLWMKGVEPSVRPPFVEAWERTASSIIDTWANSVKLVLQAQLDWTEFWTRRLSDEELWDCWFATLRNFGPAEYTSAFVDVSKSWREAARQNLDASTEWMRASPQRRQPVAASGNGADSATERPSGKRGGSPSSPTPGGI